VLVLISEMCSRPLNSTDVDEGRRADAADGFRALTSPTSGDSSCAQQGAADG